MEANVKWISKQKLLTLKLESVSYDGTVRFAFRDRLNNLYTHYQVPPSEAASYSKAALFFRGISNGTCKCLDFTQLGEGINDKLLDPLLNYVGYHYACIVRKKIMDNGRSYLDVESLFYGFPVDGEKYETCPQKLLDSESYVVDLAEMMRLAKRYRKTIKNGKLCS